ncbi:PoNi-like cognate immunity protein [[Eubacterium] hominis]|uniref:PoNi-like cognate immunity protein n=1 Tax=[Eubacterium] hominis TaxID=2764325 RepID=UPI0022E5F592
MIRDKLKDEKYFDTFISEDSKRIENFTEKLVNNQIKEERISPVKEKIHDLKLGILIANYSKGEKISQIKEQCDALYDEWPNVWQPEDYIKNLWMISIGILLEIDETKFDGIKKLLLQSGLDDWLFDVLLNYKEQDLNNISSDLMFPKEYHTLKDMVNTNKNQIDLLKHYLQKEWYSNHKDCAWHESHKSSQNTYYGYWSFESAAIAKILKLNDEELKDQQYYPYDMVHFKDE